MDMEAYACYIVASKKNNMVVGAQFGSNDPGTKVTINAPSGQATQLWIFESTPIPGVFYIKSSGTGFVLTVPVDAGQGSNPTVEVKRDGYQPLQMWKFITANSDTDLLIQNYSFGSALVLDTKPESDAGQIVHMWNRDTGNDNQKFYMRIP